MGPGDLCFDFPFGMMSWKSDGENAPPSAGPLAEAAWAGMALSQAQHGLCE